MRYPAGQKEQTRKKILETAGRIFRRSGYHASGVDRVMEEAGLTPGGFYSHFSSKQALLAEAITSAGTEARLRVEKGLGGLSGRAWVRAFLRSYLDRSHRDGVEEGCPLVALVSEVSRSDETVKASFEGILRNLQHRLISQAGPYAARPDEKALAAISMCVGGLGLARSVKDQTLVDQILASCREQAEAILCGTQEKTPGRPPSRRRREP
jgi:TetR/AcrR family transcriptional regulator, transcriptional repressor for nem operon